MGSDRDRRYNASRKGKARTKRANGSEYRRGYRAGYKAGLRKAAAPTSTRTPAAG